MILRFILKIFVAINYWVNKIFLFLFGLIKLNGLWIFIYVGKGYFFLLTLSFKFSSSQRSIRLIIFVIKVKNWIIVDIEIWWCSTYSKYSTTTSMLGPRWVLFLDLLQKHFSVYRISFSFYILQQLLFWAYSI